MKLIAKDGKNRMTDVVDIEGMFRLIESIPSKKAEPIKLWLARLGKERIDEEYDPEITINRALEAYKRKGYSEEWINQRLKSIDARKEFTDELKNKGIESSKDFAILTNILTKVWSGYSVKEYKEFKNLKKENLRDNMTDVEVALTDLGEIATRELARKHRPQGLKANRKIAKAGGEVAKTARNDLENKLGETIISKENKLNYKYIEDNKLLENKKE